MTQGEHLRKLLDSRDWTQEQLAEKASVPRETINKIVNDRRPMGPTVAPKIAQAFGLSVDEVRLPPAVEAASRKGLDLRLRSLEVEVDLWKGMLLEALALLDLQADPEADQGSRVQRGAAQGTRAGGRRR